ncbi:MAG: TPM domain-containing protein [Ruminiclostridium sp.]|nr:TPM domain-containing protein [Ruminiclostridium sp.]
MKKNLMSLLFALVMVVGLSGSALAVQTSVYDEAGVMSLYEVDILDAACQEIAQTYGCGVYILTVDDYAYYSYETDAYDFATDVYTSWGLGEGPEQNGILLMLNIYEREYALVAYGSTAHTAFTDYGKDVISENFLPSFAQDDWFGGFESYVDDCEDFLDLAAQGTPVDVGQAEPVPLGVCIGGGVLTGLIVAAIVVLVKKKGMNTAVQQRQADVYVTDSGLDLRVSHNQFIHTTVSVREIEDHKGGTTIDAKGFSGKSGKF